jgi:hypothetical protein
VACRPISSFSFACIVRFPSFAEGSC